MRFIAHFLCKNIGEVELTGDVSKFDFTVLDAVADGDFSEVEVA